MCESTDPAGRNRETLRSYESRIAEYIAGTAQEVSGATRDWIDAALSGLSSEARILEIGSAFGRDAAYIAGKGFAVTCTDAAAGFVAHLRERGFDARPLNVLTDPLPGPSDLILANAVLLHFDRDACAAVLAKLARALAPGGRLAVSLKRGSGEEWSTDKLGAPRYFRYWEPEALEPLLAAAGLARWTIAEAVTARRHAAWLHVIATAP
ncbi:class I SAM-dependent methyltransferase [Methylobacterium sp. JK268]